MEALVLNAQGYVVEGSGCNIFIVNRNGELLTPPVYLGILEGITQHSYGNSATGRPNRERVPLPAMIFIFPECFLTGTAAELIPVVSIDRRSVGYAGSHYKNLMHKFHDYAPHNGVLVYEE